MLKAATGDFEQNPVLYINMQLRYHLGMSKDELHDMSDEEWAQHYAMLENIRSEEAKRRPILNF